MCVFGLSECCVMGFFFRTKTGNAKCTFLAQHNVEWTLGFFEPEYIDHRVSFSRELFSDVEYSQYSIRYKIMYYIYGPINNRIDFKEHLIETLQTITVEIFFIFI